MELFGLFNRNKEESYTASFWIEDLKERQNGYPEYTGLGQESAGPVHSFSPDTGDNFQASEARQEEQEPASPETEKTPEATGPEVTVPEAPEPQGISGVKNRSDKNLTDFECCLETNSGVNGSGINGSEVNGSKVNGSGVNDRCGSLYISSIPTGSTIYLNGHEMGRTPQTLTGLPAGDYSLRLVLYGYETFETELKVLDGDTTPIYQPMVEIQVEEADEKPLITGLHIKAFIIFMIAGFFVYFIIEMLLKGI